MHLLPTQFDCPEVTLCSCQAVKIQLPTAYWLKRRGIPLMLLSGTSENSAFFFGDILTWLLVGISNSFYIKYAHVCHWILIGSGSNCKILRMYWISPTPDLCLLQLCIYYVQLWDAPFVAAVGCLWLHCSLWFSGIVHCGSFAPTVSVGVSLVKKEMSSKVLWKNQIQTSLCPGKEGSYIW